jgi:hypothetical protein
MRRNEMNQSESNSVEIRYIAMEKLSEREQVAIVFMVDNLWGKRDVPLGATEAAGYVKYGYDGLPHYLKEADLKHLEGYLPGRSFATIIADECYGQAAIPEGWVVLCRQSSSGERERDDFDQEIHDPEDDERIIYLGPGWNEIICMLPLPEDGDEDEDEAMLDGEV